MSALTLLLRRQAEQNPTASYFNVDILKYQIKGKEGASSCPFQLVAYWKCESTHTDLKVKFCRAENDLPHDFLDNKGLPLSDGLQIQHESDGVAYASIERSSFGSD